jgi:hypothetical protein
MALRCGIGPTKERSQDLLQSWYLIGYKRRTVYQIGPSTRDTYPADFPTSKRKERKQLKCELRVEVK